MARLIRTLLAVLLVLAFAPSASAQSWVTRALCDVDTPRIDPLALPPDRLSALRAEAAQILNGTGNFWRIAAPLGAVSHLWGTMHSSNRHVLALPDQVVQEIKSARLTALEKNYTAASREELERRFDATGWWRDVNGRQNRSYYDLEFDPDITDALDERLAWSGYAPEEIELLSLGAIIELVYGDPCEDFHADTLPVQDTRIHMLAHISGNQIKGLENPDALLHHLSAASAEPLALALLELAGFYLAPVEEALGHANRSTGIDLYNSGENAVLLHWGKDDLVERFGPQKGAQLLELTDAYLLDERNLDFLAAIRDDLEKGGVFMAIGAAHLPGENGMVELLRRNGFTVTRIKLDRER